MQNYSDLTDLATIDTVRRDGGDVVLTLRNAIRGHKLRHRGTVTFVGVTRVESVDLLNDLVQRELEAGWRVDGLHFEHGVAVLGVFQQGMHESFSVRHSISCTGVQVSMRPAMRQTLWNAFSKP